MKLRKLMGTMLVGIIMASMVVGCDKKEDTPTVQDQIPQQEQQVTPQYPDNSQQQSDDVDGAVAYIQQVISQSFDAQGFQSQVKMIDGVCYVSIVSPDIDMSMVSTDEIRQELNNANVPSIYINLASTMSTVFDTYGCPNTTVIVGIMDRNQNVMFGANNRGTTWMVGDPDIDLITQ